MPTYWLAPFVSGASARDLRPAPAASTAAAPSVGSSAHGAGKPGEDRTTNSDTTTAIRPAAAIAVRTRSPRRAIGDAATATNAPSPSSQTRTKVEKYAVAGLLEVCANAHASEAAEITAIATPATRRACSSRQKRRRRPISSSPSSSHGHTK